MSAAAGRDERVDPLLREAARWHLAGLLLRRPGPGWAGRTAALAREAADPALARAADQGGQASPGAYQALLGPGGPVSPREVSYRPLEDPGRLLAEIGAFHEAFAYRSSEEDPRDHVAVAADFAGYLALKEAWALAAGRGDDARTTEQARERFVERHVRASAQGMLRRLGRIDWPEDHLTVALRALCAMAGTGDGADGGADAPEEPAFPRPGLDGSAFDCGGFAEGGAAACADGCPWGGADGDGSGPAR